MPNHLIPIRLSHLLAQSGVGAIVRGPDELVVVRDTRQWTDRNGLKGAYPRSNRRSQKDIPTAKFSVSSP